MRVRDALVVIALAWAGSRAIDDFRTTCGVVAIVVAQSVGESLARDHRLRRLQQEARS